MRFISLISGSVLDAQRIASPVSLWTRLLPPAERRELWLDVGGQQVQFVIQCAVIPARTGHQVALLSLDGAVVGLHNLTTGRAVNYVRQSPPPLLRRWERAAAAATAIGSAIAACHGHWPTCAGAAILLAGYLLVSLPGRRRQAFMLRRKVDALLVDIERQRQIDPIDIPLRDEDA